MNRPHSPEIEAELLRAAEEYPGVPLVLGSDGIARPVPSLAGLAHHIMTMADDAYLTGHPEWLAIVDEARACLARRITNAPVPEDDRTSFDVMRVPVISTAHITPADGAQLLKAEPRDVLDTLWDSSGHIIHADPDEDVAEAFPPGRFSDAFREVVQFFRAQGFEYLRLDSNGLTIPDLPTFEW